MRDCTVRLEYDLLQDGILYDVAHGMLCTVRVEPIPDQVKWASERVENIENFYLQVEEIQQRDGDVHQVVCHVHGITPANRPLGWRVLVLEGNDLLYLDWIDQMMQLWPFEATDARITFCTMATDDLRGKRAHPLSLRH